MKWLVFILLAWTARADDPFREPALRTLMDCVTLHLRLDGSLQPDLASWDPTVRWLPRTHDQTPDYTEGLHGQALVLGTGSAVIPHVTLGPRGTIAFWIKPEDWRHDQDSNSIFVQIGDRLILERMGPKEDQRRGDILAIVRGRNGTRASSVGVGDLPNGEWALIVFSWS